MMASIFLKSEEARRFKYYGDNNNKWYYYDSRTNVWTNKGAAEVPGAIHAAVRQYLKQLSVIVTTVLPWMEFLEGMSERYHVRLPDKPPSWTSRGARRRHRG